MRRLTVLYDSKCGFCVRCRHWIDRQEKMLGLELLPATAEQVRRRFPTLRHADPPEELVVIDDEGGVYRGADAWIMCLYALADYREWSQRVATPALRPLARSAFEWISTHRRSISRQLGLSAEQDVVAVLQPLRPTPCVLEAPSAGAPGEGGR